LKVLLVLPVQLELLKPQQTVGSLLVLACPLVALDV
jgi:hypothetical protein